jgi:uncharacterized membrane protein
MSSIFKKESFLLAVIVMSSFILNIINNGYQLSGDERASLNSAAGAGITTNRFEGNKSFRYTQAAPLEKNIFTQYDYSKRNTPKNVIRSTINFDSGNMVAYHLMLHGWLNFLVISVFNARLLSALLAVLTVLFTYLLVKKLTGNISIAFTSSIILAIHPLLLHHAHMARGYAASLCFTTAAAYVVLHIRDKNISSRKRMLLYVTLSILATLGILSHYLSVAVFIFYALWLITDKNFFRQHSFPATLTLLITSSIIFLWLQNGGFEGMNEMKKIDAWYLKNTSAQVHTSPRSLMEGTVQQLLAIFGNYGQYLGFRLRSIAFLLLFPLAAILFSLKYFKNTLNKNTLRFLVGAVITVIVFSAMLAIKAGHTTSFNARYGIYAIPFASALLAVALHAVVSGSIPKTKRLFTGFSLLVTFIVFIFSAIPAYTGIAATYNSNPQLHKDVLDFNLNKYYLQEYNEPTAKKIERMYAAGDTVIYNDWNTAQVINLFLHDRNKTIVQKVELNSEHRILYFEKVSGLYKVISEE